MKDKYLLAIKKSFDHLIGADFPLEEIKKLASNAIIKQYYTGEYLLRSGEMSREICFIATGLVRLFYTCREGKEYTKNFKSSGQFAGSQAALLLAAPTKLSIQALEDSEVLRVDYDNALR